MPGFLKKFLSNPHRAAVTAVILTALLVFGTGISRLGYYHDDWYMLWSAALRGPASLIPLFSMDRPFMGVIYSLTYRVIGENIAGWHWYALAWRIAGALAFYWILHLAWPKYRSLHGLAAVLFLVYPGYLSQPNAATKINHLIGFGSALFSIALTLLAARAATARRRQIYSGLSLLLMALYLWLYEYMIGLEVMRLALLFWRHWQGRRDHTRPALRAVWRAYLPHLALMALFLFWRVFIFDSTRIATDMKGLVFSYLTDFLSLLLRLFFQVIKDFFSTSVFAWGVQPYDLFSRAGFGEMTIAFLLAGLVVLVVLGSLRSVARYAQAQPAPPDEAETPSPWVLVAAGALVTLGAVTPVVLTIHHLDLLDEYKSYGLHPSPGVIILVVGIMAMLKNKFRSPALVALIALSVTTQSLNTQDWIKYWDVQKSFWWQLTWRAPHIRENTLLMAYGPQHYAFQQDYEVWGPASLIYYPLPDIVPAIQSEVLNPDTLYEVYKGELTDPYVRDIFMPRDFGKVLLVSQPGLGSCIHVIDGQMPVYSANERAIVEKAGPYSNLALIDPTGQAPTPPATIFGKEPEHGWCFYYQKAALARQLAGWAAIGELYDSAQAAGLAPRDPVEYFVFVEGLVNAGRMEDARALADRSLKTNEQVHISLCRTLAAAPAYPVEFGYRLEEIRTLVCGE